MPLILRTGICILAVWMTGLSGSPAAYAQQQRSPSVDVLGGAYQRAQHAHLWRIALWGGVNALGGMALMASTGRSGQPARWGFGMQSAAWGVINVGIATAGLFTAGSPPAEADALLDAERSFHDILLFNLGLNVAYSSIGTAMLTASYQGVDHARAWRGHGSALILQGLGLLVLDGIAFFASRARLTDLLRVTGNLSARALPMGVALTLSI